MSSDLRGHFQTLKIIRNFFEGQGFLDVLTPPVVENPGMEVHIHPFQLQSAYSKKVHDLYLHTSPEFWMKDLLSHGLDKIFTLSYCFRDEPDSPHHRKQFIMLEWYRAHERYEKIMEDTKGLIHYTAESYEKLGIPLRPFAKTLKFEEVTCADLFESYLKFSILDFLDKDELKKKIEKDHKDVPLPQSECDWDDYYFLLFLNKIEPFLINHPALLLKEFPAPLAALSTLKSNDPRVAERFEVYLNGVELCNCFNELTDIKAQRERFQAQHDDKLHLYNYELPKANILFNALERGYPKSAGIAMGVERLYLSLADVQNPFFV